MERLKMFLYLLMRDKLPTGQVVDMVKDVEGAAQKEGANIYTAKPLEVYARQLAGRIVGRDGEDEITRMCAHCFAFGHNEDNCPAKSKEAYDDLYAYFGSQIFEKALGQTLEFAHYRFQVVEQHLDGTLVFADTRNKIRVKVEPVEVKTTDDS